MTGQLELWSGDWATEPCGDSDDWTDDQLAEWLHSRPRPIPGDHGRAAGRATYGRLRRIHTIKITGSYL